MKEAIEKLEETVKKTINNWFWKAEMGKTVYDGVCEKLESIAEIKRAFEDLKEKATRLDITEAERETLDNIYDEEPALTAEGIGNFDGYYVHYDKFFKAINQAWPDVRMDYLEDPLELVTKLIEERDELKGEIEKLKIMGLNKGLQDKAEIKEAKTIKNTLVCERCQRVFAEDDDFDTLGSKSGICCPDCGTEDFISVEDLILGKQPLKAELKRLQAIQEGQQAIICRERRLKEEAQGEVKRLGTCLNEANCKNRDHEIEAARLKKAVRTVCRGEIEMPDFKEIEEGTIITTKPRETTSEAIQRYMFEKGWEEAMFLCGEVLARAMAEEKLEEIEAMLKRGVKSKREVMEENEGVYTGSEENVEKYLRDNSFDIEKMETIIERIMMQHWDMAACRCWVCQAGREAGCRPREEYLLCEHESEKKYGHVTVEKNREEDEKDVLKHEYPGHRGHEYLGYREHEEKENEKRNQ